MPSHFDFDFDNKIIRCRVDGVVTDDSLREHYREIAAHGAARPTFRGLLDMSGVTALNVTSNTIRELAALPPAIPDPDVPRVIVAGSAQMFGMARMFELQGAETRPNLHVVRTERDAFAILGVRSPEFSQHG
ncbi:MAG: hypothetical protein WB985_12085 [Candidatus Acidiferrales bacterium]